MLPRGVLSAVSWRPAWRRIACAGAATALVGLAAWGCGGASGGDKGGPSAAAYERALAGAPARLARLYEDGNRLLPGGLDAFEQRLADLRGHPVVVNKWASWCGPCREELPWFQDLSARLGKRIAFVGVDSDDSRAAARTFMNEFPVPYPSYADPDEDIAQAIEATVGFPATAFYDRGGGLVYVRQGQYSNEADLAADIRRYAR
jgi:cytochrome c biogenesis protein CcmG/thiol:disulfide interchange protein DsbE